MPPTKSPCNLNSGWSYYGDYESPWSYNVIAWSPCLTMIVYSEELISVSKFREVNTFEYCSNKQMFPHALKSRIMSALTQCHLIIRGMCSHVVFGANSFYRADVYFHSSCFTPFIYFYSNIQETRNRTSRRVQSIEKPLCQICKFVPLEKSPCYSMGCFQNKYSSKFWYFIVCIASENSQTETKVWFF